MKTKDFFRLSLMMVMGLTFAACSQSDDVASEQNTTQQMVGTDGLYHYTMQLNCSVPSDDAADGTRAVTYDWANGSTIYVRFNTSGSSYVNGTATYNSSQKSWSISSTSSLSANSSALKCELYYFVNPVSVGSSVITLDEKTACYYTTSATYVCTSSNVISVSGNLNRKTWRMRFKGTNGTTVSLPSSENDIKYLSSFNRQTGGFADSQKDVQLTVNSSGYTDYIYGAFKNSGSNSIYLENSSVKDYYFTRSLTSSQLAVGESAYLTVPTEYSYSGWDRKKHDGGLDPNATIQVENPATFTDGIAMTFTFGSTVNTFDFIVLSKSSAASFSDDELANKIYSSDPYTSEDFDYLFKNTNSSTYSANTEYYLCAVGKNASGQRGPVLRYLFKTNATTLPYAEISNVKAASSTKWTYSIALKNSAKSYYLATSTDEDDYNKDWHWFAYYTYRWGSSGQLEAHDWTSVATTLSSGSCNLITICTWGLDSSNKFGNPNVAYGSANSSSRALRPVVVTKTKDSISKKEIEKMRERIKIYKIDESF